MSQTQKTAPKNPKTPYILGGLLGGCFGGAAVGAMIATGGVRIAPSNALIGAIVGAIVGAFVGFRMSAAVHMDMPEEANTSQGMFGKGFGRAFADLFGSVLIWALLGYLLGRASDYLFVTTQGWLIGALVCSVLIPLLYSLSYSSSKSG